ncbi:hypothetical protein M569_01714, partial [Genlisea aurea]
ANEFRLASSHIDDGGRLPRQYTGEGQGAKRNISPPLEWYNVPDGTKSLALVALDVDAPWTIWVVVDIPPTAKGFPEGFSGGREDNDGDSDEVVGGIIREGYCDMKKRGWHAPVLPDHGHHRIEFKLYAIDDELNHLGKKVTKEKLEESIVGHVLGEAVL